MSRRKKKFVPKPFESSKSDGDTSANIYKSMLMSEAWKDLTKPQRNLYLCMKSELFGNESPLKEDQQAFTFNRAKWIKETGKQSTYSFELYTKPNDFYKDRDALVSHGFIEVVERNKYTREANIYRYSGQWQTWKRPP